MPVPLRLRGRLIYSVPTTTDGAGKRQGGFGFVRCDGVLEGDLDPGRPAPIGVDHFVHVRDASFAARIEDLDNKALAFTPTPHPKGPRATDVEVVP